MYNQIYTGHCNNLSSNMKQFAKNNKDTVEEMISSEKQQQKDLKTKIKQIESNLTLLKNIAENSTAIIAASY